MIDFYNNEVDRYEKACANIVKKDWPNIEEIIETDPSKISWTRGLKKELSQFRKHRIHDGYVKSIYRPFCKQWLYFDSTFNEMVLQMPKIFPYEGIQNLAICISGVGARSGFSVLMMNSLPNMDSIEKGQCFPLYLYDKSEGDSKDTDDLFSTSNNQTYTRKDGLSDEGTAHFREAYAEEVISKEDVFYYIYGILHSNEYRERYANNLTKELPRIPCVKKAKDFWFFSKAGRDLSELHVNYETVDCYPVKMIKGIKRLSGDDYKVSKMKFAKKPDKSVVIYNQNITISNIPLEAYNYIVNGKPALEWVMDRQAVTTDKKSGIKNDANLWATETMGNAKYPLELFQRVITVSLETMRIVNALPKLDIDQL